MATPTPLTFESVNEHVEKNFTATKAQAIPDLCSIYGIVRPILNFVLPLIPQKWRDAIKILIQILDAQCPGH